MNELWVTLFLKATAVLAAAAVAAFAMRCGSAAARHLVWTTAFAALIVLPVGSLLPAGTPAPILASAGPVLAAAADGVAATTGLLPYSAAALWAAGSIVLLLRLGRSALRIRGLLLRARSSGGPLFTTPELSTPAVWGLIRPRILFPPAFCSWPAAMQRAILLHEHAHLQRRDCWVLLAAELACALYWPNPLVWYAAARLRREQEDAADDQVLVKGCDPAEYAGYLVALARSAGTPPLLAGAVAESDLTRRVTAILDNTRRRSMLTKQMLTVSAFALLLIALPLAALQNQRKVYKVGEDGVTQPQVLTKIEPQYTDAAREAGIQGTVLLGGIVEVDGAVRELGVVRGLEAGLDANAIAAVSSWSFKPAEKDGKPVPVSVRIEVNFRLK
jgi:TonB family protein